MGEKYIIVRGNPVDGLDFTGPFNDPETANNYAESDKISEYWIANIYSPCPITLQELR